MCQVPFYVAFYVNYDQIFKFHKSGTWNPNSLALTLEGKRISCVCYTMARITVNELTDKFKYWELIHVSLSNMSMLYWVNNAHLVRKLHGSAFSIYQWLKFHTKYKCISNIWMYKFFLFFFIYWWFSQSINSSWLQQILPCRNKWMASDYQTSDMNMVWSILALGSWLS